MSEDKGDDDSDDKTEEASSRKLEKAKEEGKGDRISLPPEEQELYEWLRRNLGYRADMSKGRYVDTKSDMYGE